MLTSRACSQDPSFLRRQERALTRSAIPAQAGTRAHKIRHSCTSPRHACAPLPVIPAQAGTTRTPTLPPSPPNLPPSRGEVRWGVGAPSQRQPLSNTPNRLSHHSRAPPPSLPHPFSHHFLRPSPVIPAPLPVIPAQAGIPTSPQPCYHTPRRTRVRAMPTSPNTNHPRAQTAAAHAAASLRTTPNKPEQIRTNPNTAERPDQIGPHPESPPNTRKKENPNSAPERSTPLHAQTTAAHAAASLRTTPNKPEQIRTNPNTAKRPDQIGPHPESPPTPRKKENPNSAPNGLHHRAAAASHAQAGRRVCCDGFRSTH